MKDLTVLKTASRGNLSLELLHDSTMDGVSLYPIFVMETMQGQKRMLGGSTTSHKEVAEAFFDTIVLMFEMEVAGEENIHSSGSKSGLTN